MKMSRRVKILLAFVVVVVGGYIAANIIGGSGGVPADFSVARLQGALIAQTIVNLSGQSVSDLEKISQFDRERNFTEALNLTSKVISQSQEIRNQAAALSAEIEKMTRALSDVRPPEAKELALEAITDRLVLISRLINYSAYLSQLADALRNRFAGSPGNHQVSVIIAQVNDEIQAINGLNKKATETMERFDKLVE